MSRINDLTSKLKDVSDIARRIRSPMEIVKMALPESIRGHRVLNDGPISPDDTALDTQQLVQRLRGIRNVLKGDAYVIDGGVDYARLAKSDTFAELERVSAALRQIDPSAMASDDERLAFWINLYNVLMIHGVIALGIRDSVMEVPSFFGTVAYRIQDHLVTPDIIEHGILRRNAASPTSGKTQLDPGDPRLAWSPSTLDARIHVALVCVARSCPPIAFYDHEHIDAQLDLAAEAFVLGSVRVEPDERAIHMSKIFSFYPHDFDGEQGALDFAERYAEPDHQAAIAQARAEGYAVVYDRYDWSLNAL